MANILHSCLLYYYFDQVGLDKIGFAVVVAFGIVVVSVDIDIAVVFVGIVVAVDIEVDRSQNTLNFYNSVHQYDFLGSLNLDIFVILL